MHSRFDGGEAMLRGRDGVRNHPGIGQDKEEVGARRRNAFTRIAHATSAPAKVNGRLVPSGIYLPYAYINLPDLNTIHHDIER